MAKVNIKSETITPFEGIYYAGKAFYALSLAKVPNSNLSVRGTANNGYKWDELISTMSDMFLVAVTAWKISTVAQWNQRESPKI